MALTVRIKEGIHKKYRYPECPWYLGGYVNDVYAPHYEGKTFEVVEYDENKYSLADEGWALNNLGHKTAWINKSDAEII